MYVCKANCITLGKQTIMFGYLIQHTHARHSIIDRSITYIYHNNYIVI